MAEQNKEGEHSETQPNLLGSDVPVPYVVAIGASAGGFEAYTALLELMPVDTGLVFVLVPHLDPKHGTSLPELLQRSTGMPVRQIEDGDRMEPNTLHIIPPDRDLGLMDGVFQLVEREPGERRLPINYFFHSLADDQREHAIAIILSGTGSDGTVGLRAIKENLGLVIVQDPGTAKYSGMPDSAIETGLADYVLRIDEIPSCLLKYIQVGRKRLRLDNQTLSESESQALRKIFYLLRSRSGHDFTGYKHNTIFRRVERRMNVHHLDEIQDYARLLETDSQEVDALFKDLLISVTSFFRDPEAFEALKNLISERLDSKREEDEFRVWVPGVATGEEAYSIAIIISEILAVREQTLDVQIFATDLVVDAIDRSRDGVYPAAIVSDVGEERLRRFFVREGDSYRVNREIRAMIIFATQDVTRDPPFTKLDLICCRNLLIYLDSALQQRLLPVFHYSLLPGGILFLGASETVGEYTNLFKVTHPRWKLFEAKAQSPDYRPALGFAGRSQHYLGHQANSELRGGPRIGQITDKLLLESYVPPCVVIDHEDKIKYIHGRTGNYLEPAPGKANMNVVTMAREGLQLFLPSAIRKSRQTGDAVRKRNIKVKHNDSTSVIDLIVRPLSRGKGDPELLLVVFEETLESEKSTDVVSLPREGDDQQQYVTHLQTELEQTRENLRSTIEELETSNEELKSMNEEFQSTNEELKSANEELETSREELQSLNEELSTVNAELQEKIARLSRTSTEMQQYLNSIENPTLFLDRDLKIRRFTIQAQEVVNLVETDIGRPLAHITSRFRNDTLLEDTREVLKTLQRDEREVQTETGDWYLRRIIPYHNPKDVIDGVVINFVNISEMKQRNRQMLEAQKAQALAEAINNTVRDPMVVLDSELRVKSTNSAFLQKFGLIPDDVDNSLLYEVKDGVFDISELRRLLSEVLPEKESFEGFVVERDFPGLGHKKLRLDGRMLAHQEESVKLVFVVIREESE